MGNEHVRLHNLRHTFASWIASNPGIPLTKLRDLLGHSSLAASSKYAHLRRYQEAKSPHYACNPLNTGSGAGF